MYNKYNSNKIAFHAADLIDALKQRNPDSPSLAAKRDLERYYTLLEDALPTLDLSEAEALLIFDALNGVKFSTETIQLLRYNVADGIEERLDQKWGVNGKALLQKLKSYNHTQLFALADAIEQLGVDSYQIADLATELKRVGLISG